MKSFATCLCLLFSLGWFTLSARAAATAGSARLETTLATYSGDPAHWTVAWVTTSSGTFIKSLRKQGPTITSSHWNSHCSTWYAAKGGSTGSTALDGYSSASAFNYTGTNSPVNLTWNCRDASNSLVADGQYKFWVQYAEDGGQGPVTTSGFLWTKGPVGATNTYANQGINFTTNKVTWIPVATVAPTFTSAAPPASGTVGVPYNFTCAASGTTPITYSASGLPAGLTISSAGVISGLPTTPGAFAGSIVAANGTLPNATQAFSINVSLVPTSIGSIRLDGNNLVVTGNGPANGRYAVLAAVAPAGSAWSPVKTNNFSGSGAFSFTNALTPGVSQLFYRLRVP